jgi:hypothetical protein
MRMKTNKVRATFTGRSLQHTPSYNSWAPRRQQTRTGRKHKADDRRYKGIEQKYNFGGERREGKCNKQKHNFYI